MRKSINELINHINNIDNQEKLLIQKHDNITIGTSEKIKEKIPTVTVESLYGISEQMIKNRNDRDKIYFLSDELTRMCDSMKSITDYAGKLQMQDVYSKIFKNYGLNKNDINYYQYKFAIERAQLKPESFMFILDHLFSVIINLYEAINVEKQNNEIWKNKNEILSNQYNE